MTIPIRWADFDPQGTPQLEPNQEECKSNTEKGRIPETTLACIRHLRRVSPRSTISVEVEKPNRDGLDALAAEADAVFYSRSWAEVGERPPPTCTPCLSHVCCC